MATLTLSEATAQIKKLETEKLKLSEVVKAKETAEEEAAVKLAEKESELAAKDLELAETKKKTATATVAAKEAEKKAAFDVKLSEGKVCEAQRTPWMANDTAKFLELAEPVKLKAVGTGDPAAVGSDADPQTEIIRRAKVLLSEKKVKNFTHGVNVVLSESPELKKKYYEGEGMKEPVSPEDRGH